MPPSARISHGRGPPTTTRICAASFLTIPRMPVRHRRHAICGARRKLGHDVACAGVGSDLAVIRRAMVRNKPHIVFNLVEQFDGLAFFDQHVVSYLELRKQKYTGCNPRGLMLARDKALAKKIL